MKSSTFRWQNVMVLSNLFAMAPILNAGECMARCIWRHAHITSHANLYLGDWATMPGRLTGGDRLGGISRQQNDHASRFARLVEPHDDI